MSYPLMILTKSSKPLPVMAVGVFFYGRVYAWYKYVSIILLIIGIYLFTAAKSSSSTANSSSNEKLGAEDPLKSDVYVVLFGMLLVLVNLGMDGYTNNEQDSIFRKYSASSNQMMKYVNLWQCLYQLLYLGAGWAIYADDSELTRSLYMMLHSRAVCLDIVMFCICASVGQVLIFNVMREFGSLAWITISVTRKLFTIVRSVIMFQHKVNAIQWCGVALVFIGLGMDAVLSLYAHPQQEIKTSVDDKKKK